ncbi:ATP-GRASP peptide maturase, grasp-with-spasm system [Tenacibaculum sp. MAR_2009_124]|uniref:grasp-with-spasm system ATP-grasp peptide maturase n=1 Tax=Tenacibaculum sp. MAR_2009_124 TaxID=1250059 RepID=UPI0008978C2A|nr:grasp-with-spasm system ATP-grasp peptide maturase [Tenacibaculum sp. MAR_2009_124]SEB94809.1 ATP-GRASP peptide maturase, grasp-with-spasm system [Tenacibaculum sp. MAR_2009_124]
MDKHLIVTQDRDGSSNEVCNWFYRYNVPFKRLNLDSYKIIDRNNDLYLDYFNFDDIDISIPGKTKVNDENFTEKYISIWYRRPSASVENMVIDQTEPGLSRFLLNKIRSNQKSELKELYKYIFNSSLQGSVVLGNRLKTRVNKLEILSLANKLSICIPKTRVISKKSQILEFQKEVNNSLITKSIYEPIAAMDDDLKQRHISYTNELTESILDKIPDYFSPSLVQERVEKDFEIRTFVMGENFYSMAIFSQNNEKTAVDFRRYDRKKPNRNIPFTLPEELTIKIKELLKIIGFNTGSIDIIKSKNGKYYFLEINSVGQFGMVSKPCNYNIEYHIYKYLTRNEEKTS